MPYALHLCMKLGKELVTLRKIFILYKSQGKYSDKLMAIYSSKGRAIEAKYFLLQVSKNTADYFIVERYVID